MASAPDRRRPQRLRPARRSPSRSASLLSFEPLEFRWLFVGDLPRVVERPTVNLSAYEQLLVEQINYSRAHPIETAFQLGIGLNEGLKGNQSISPGPKAPLAIRQSLVDAAGSHSLKMLAQDVFDHELPDASGTSTPASRALAQGYAYPVGENIAVRSIAYDPSQEVLATHDQLFRSPGHRANLLRDDYRDLGVGVRRGEFRYASGANLDSCMTTEMFGLGHAAAITGVVFDDAILDDDRYSADEGIAGALVQATASDGTIYRTHSGTSGGYTLDVPAGDYVLQVSGAGLPHAVTIPSVRVAGLNVKVDVTRAMSASTVPPLVLDDGPSSTTPPSLANLLAYDVSGDGQITPGDALMVLNYLNDGSGGFDAIRDVTGDGVVAPIDALMVINFMNVYGGGFLVPSEQTLAFEPVLDVLAAAQLDRADQAATETDDDVIAGSVVQPVPHSSRSAALRSRSNLAPTEQSSMVRALFPSYHVAPAAWLCESD